MPSSVRRRLADVSALVAPVVAAAAVTGSKVLAPPVAGAAGFPGNTMSYYIDDIAPSQLADLGCYDGAWSVSGPRNVILDFGAQEPDTASSDGWGALSPDMTTVLPDYSSTTESIEDVADDFASGWSFCSPDQQGDYLGIGTNNSGGSVGEPEGAVWGELALQSALQYESDTGAAGLVHFRAADDIEPSWSSWSAVKEWVGGGSPGTFGATGQGGLQATGASYFDFGSADGCVTTCTNGWSPSKVYDAASGWSGAVAAPQIYDTGQQQDWQVVESGGGPIDFSTAFSEHALATDTFCPSTSWADLQAISPTGAEVAATNISDTDDTSDDTC